MAKYPIHFQYVRAGWLRLPVGQANRIPLFGKTPAAAPVGGLTLLKTRRGVSHVQLCGLAAATSHTGAGGRLEWPRRRRVAGLPRSNSASPRLPVLPSNPAAIPSPRANDFQTGSSSLLQSSNGRNCARGAPFHSRLARRYAQKIQSPVRPRSSILALLVRQLAPPPFAALRLVSARAQSRAARFHRDDDSPPADKIQSPRFDSALQGWKPLFRTPQNL